MRGCVSNASMEPPLQSPSSPPAPYRLSTPRQSLVELATHVPAPPTRVQPLSGPRPTAAAGRRGRQGSAPAPSPSRRVASATGSPASRAAASAWHVQRRLALLVHEVHAVPQPHQADAHHLLVRCRHHPQLRSPRRREVPWAGSPAPPPRGRGHRALRRSRARRPRLRAPGRGGAEADPLDQHRVDDPPPLAQPGGGDVLRRSAASLVELPRRAG